MFKRFLLLAVLCVPAFAAAKPETWVEVSSPHFYVVSNSNEKQARHVADQFERMRSVFHKLFPKLQIDTVGSITVLAIKDEKDFRALEPAAYLAKGQLKLGGLFLRGADKNYVLLRLDAEGEHPYAVVYHEYTHLLLSKISVMPLWLNEGLAEFYQNTDIHEKEVSLGQGSPENLALLRQNRLMPLATLFAVDNNSPYYHEQNKGSIFYGESWALTHFLEFGDLRDHTHRITDYLQLVDKGTDTVAAATRAFGDLKQLQAALEGYVRQESFHYLRMPGATDVDDATFQFTTLSTTQADAVRADFLAYNQRNADARVLLDHILKDDPKNVLAHETMGYLEFREQHLDAARNWYAQAVKLDSQSYLAHYYFAAISMNGSMNAAPPPEVENSLRTSIKLNPNFAPSYESLGALLAMRHGNLDEAYKMELKASELEPANLLYRINSANVLMEMGRANDAIALIQNAMHLATSPEQTALAQTFIVRAQEFAQAEQQNRRYGEEMKAQISTTEIVSQTAEPKMTATAITLDQPPPNAPHRFITGTLSDVHCDSSRINLTVASSGKTLGLHASNYFKVQYSVLNVSLKGDLNPCADLNGRLAKVEYVESTDNSAFLLAVEIHK